MVEIGLVDLDILLLFKLRLPTNDPFIVDDGSNNERFRVNACGQVKIGGNTLVTPDTDAVPDNLVIDTGDVDSGISILSATTGRIYFGDDDDHIGKIVSMYILITMI